LLLVIFLETLRHYAQVAAISLYAGWCHFIVRRMVPFHCTQVAATSLHASCSHFIVRRLLPFTPEVCLLYFSRLLFRCRNT